MKQLFSVIFAALLAQSAHAEQVLFAVVPSQNYGSPFHFVFDSGRFVGPAVSGPEFDLLDTWSTATNVRGMDASGRTIDLTVLGVHQPTGDIGDRPIAFRIDTDLELTPPMLVWTGAASVEYVRATPTSLAPSALSALQQGAKGLVSSAVARRGAKLNWSLSDAQTRRVAGTTFVIANTPVSIVIEDSTDNRGNVFQVFDTAKGKIAWQHFGHPEWTSEPSGVLEVSAPFVFRVAGHAQLFIAGEHGSGWESSEWAIYDLATGQVLSVAY